MKMGNTCAMISNRVLLWIPLSAAASTTVVTAPSSAARLKWLSVHHSPFDPELPQPLLFISNKYNRRGTAMPDYGEYWGPV
jgi:hypothetical protein